MKSYWSLIRMAGNHIEKAAVFGENHPILLETEEKSLEKK